MVMETIHPKQVIRTGSHQITTLCCIRRNEKDFLLAGTSNGLLLVWDLKTQVIQQEIEASNSSSTVLTLLSYNDYIISHTRSATARLWRWNSEESLVVEKEFGQEALSQTFCCCACAALREELHVAVPHEDKLTLYTLPGGHAISSITSTEGMCMSLAMFAKDDSVKLLLGAETGNICLYQLLGGSVNFVQLSSLSTSNEPVMTLDYNCLHNYGIAAGPKQDLCIWRLSNDDKLIKHLSVKAASSGFNNVKIRYDCKLCVLCSWDGIVRLFSLKRGQLLARLEFHRDSVTSISFNYQQEFYTASNDGIICAWDLYSNKISK